MNRAKYSTLEGRDEALNMVLKLANSILVITILLLVGETTASFAQKESWQRIAPIGYSFTILMPERASVAHRRITVSDQDSIPVAVYQSVTGGKRYAVVPLLKTSPDTVPALSSYEKFIAAMERSFKSDESPKSLTFEQDVSLEGVSGKQYRVKLGEYHGVAWFLGTREAFYALVVIGAEESDKDVARFLSSFQSGELNTNYELSGVNSGVVTLIGSGSSTPKRSSATPSPETTVSTDPPEPWPQPVGPIMGGVLNGKAIHLAVPEYPAAARVLHASGAVQVQVLIDELGNVIRAEALTGPSSLREVAAAAAWKSRFTPTRLMGQPVRVNGIIIYNFVAR